MLYTLYTGGLVPVFGVSVCVRGGGWTASMSNPMYEGGGGSKHCLRKSG